VGTPWRSHVITALCAQSGAAYYLACHCRHFPNGQKSIPGWPPLPAVAFPLFSEMSIMRPFPVHTIESAPEASRPSLAALQNAFGKLPNIAGAMATSPVLIDALVGLFGKVHGGSFAEDEIQIVLLTDAVVNASTWAVAFHSALALQQGITASEVDAIRDGRLPDHPKHAALSVLARAMIEKRGHLSGQDMARFLDAGFDNEHLLEVITIVAASTITNYTATIANPPLDDDFREYVWALA
jgi:alkylhydroperoxidase family enzyme